MDIFEFKRFLYVSVFIVLFIVFELWKYVDCFSEDKFIENKEIIFFVGI